MINEQIINMNIIICVLLCMNILVSILSVLFISSKIRELKNITDNHSKTNTVDTTSKKDVSSKKDKDNNEYNGIGGKIKKFIEFAEDDEFDDDYLFDEQRLAKDRTNEIIDLIDLYEVKYNLNKDLVTDVKAGKFELLTEKKLLRLNDKYNKIINPITAKNQTQKAKRVVVKKRFANGQDLVNYVAEDSDNRLIYDTKLKTNSKVHAFDIDDNGNLLIYYSKYGAPSIFKPNRYGVAG